MTMDFPFLRKLHRSSLLIKLDCMSTIIKIKTNKQKNADTRGPWSLELFLIMFIPTCVHFCILVKKVTVFIKLE